MNASPIQNSNHNTLKSNEDSPNELLCDLANYLIQLTVLKQKLFADIETVSIETDVGLLTKSDYFKWME